MPLSRAHVLVSGEVQGVGFRYSTVAEASRLGLRGWVRNLPDGRVELEAEGERDRLDALVAWCRHGPPAAEVTHVDVEWAAHRGDLAPFSTRR